MTLPITYDSSHLHYYYNNAIPRITCLTMCIIEINLVSGFTYDVRDNVNNVWCGYFGGCCFS
jgi:hypothetical protein